jgi:hypothetical protein
MREALIILAVIAILLGLTAFKYRKQLAAMLEIWRTIKKLQRAHRNPEQVASASQDSGTLVSCARCRTWVPADRAVRLGKTTTYCSTTCLERAARPA